MYKNFSNQTVSSFDLLKERERVAAVAHFSLLTGKRKKVISVTGDLDPVTISLTL